MSWKVPRIWNNEEVWILGGGPSVPKQFSIPDEVMRKVIAGTLPPSAYSPYMEGIHNKHVIGINIAFMVGNWMDIIFFGDQGFFKRYHEQLSVYPGIRVTCIDLWQEREVPWVKYVPKDHEHAKGISPLQDKVSWNKNSGAAAISLAVHLGATRIILLGFDMNINDKFNQHWHDVYQRGLINTSNKHNKTFRDFARHLDGFEAIAKDAEQMGVQIINASPLSRIKQFPKIQVKYLL